MRICVTIGCCLNLVWIAAAEGNGDWPRWRGPSGNGYAAADEKPPLKWSESEKVLWKSAVPGRGHSSPIVVGDRLFLTTAREDSKKQSALCFAASTGELLWETFLLEGELPDEIHHNNSHASPTVAYDGERVFALFYTSDKSLKLFALDLNGKELWQVNAGVFDSEYTFGYGASPVVVEGLVVVSNDSQGTGYLIAYDCETGKEVWRTSRPAEKSSFGTVVLGEIGGEPQLLTNGHGQRTAGYSPLDGRELWSVQGGQPLTASSVVWGDGVVFASGGFPGRETWATDVANRKVLWTSPVKCYEQSMLLWGDSLFGVAEGGLMHCWNVADGEIRWRTRLPKGPESASLVHAGGYLYHANEEGEIFVIRPDPEKLDLVAENKLGDEIFATPAVAGNRLFYRVAHYEGETRRESLYAIGD